ncbi:MAG: transcriptional regulator [Hydrogenophaga sp.]|nr:transcriptional regulator [Hydrogenophaga sp.]
MPSTRDAVLARIASERLIEQHGPTWSIRNLGALLLARKLSAFGLAIERKAPRLVVYEGINKLRTRLDRQGQRGYAVGFEGLVSSVRDAAPMNAVVEKTIREEVRMFPEQALRELLANALVHQDFNVGGAGVMIEMYADRVEISNPGSPAIQVERFIDEYRSRNERLADLMRRLGICEEKGSGVDKVVHAAEAFQLPAPDFRIDTLRTTAVLFGHRDFQDMGKADRVRACYQHCCLMYVSNQRMSNQTFRERLGLGESKAAAVSQIIGDAQDLNLIRLDDAQSTSRRYARYVPFWA